MPRKIHINESSLDKIARETLLPRHLYKMVDKHRTSLGNHEAFPIGGDTEFDYALLKERWNEVRTSAKELGLASYDNDYVMGELSKAISKCMELERPIRDELERICENAVNRIFAIPKDIVNLEVRLVDRIVFKKSVRLTPEEDGETLYSFEDVDDIDMANKAVSKRRLVNALVQGGSYTLATRLDTFKDDIDKVNRDLMPLYERIMRLNDYLLFTKKEEMTDENPMQGSYVDVKLSTGGQRCEITAQGIVFPLLLQETVRGFLELFASHGLPSDRKKARYVVSKADFILAEPWDLRLGVGLWRRIFTDEIDTNAIPYMMQLLCMIPSVHFAKSVREMLSNTRKGAEIKSEIYAKAVDSEGYEAFKNRINARNTDKAVISDSYFTAADKGGMEIDSDDDGDNVISEND